MTTTFLFLILWAFFGVFAVVIFWLFLSMGRLSYEPPYVANRFAKWFDSLPDLKKLSVVAGVFISSIIGIVVMIGAIILGSIFRGDR